MKKHKFNSVKTSKKQTNANKNTKTKVNHRTQTTTQEHQQTDMDKRFDIVSTRIIKSKNIKKQYKSHLDYDTQT